MKYKDFENHIRDIYQQDSAPVDTDALIASLGLPVQTSKRRTIPWWMIGTSLIVLGLLAGFILTDDQRSSGHKVSADHQSVDDPMSIDHSNEILSDIYQQNATGAENTNLNKINLSAEREQGTISNKASSPSTIQVEYHSKNYQAKGDIEQTEEAGSIARSNDAYIGRESRNESSIHTKTNDETLLTANATQESSTSIDAIENSSEQMEIEEAKESRELISVLPLMRLASLVETDTEREITDPECPSFSSKTPFRISVLAELGYMVPFKDLNQVNVDTTSVFALRESNEDSKEAIQVGLHLKMSKGKLPFYIRGGVAYTRIAEQMNEEYSYTEQDTMRGLISITTSTTGDTITAIYGDIITETTYSGRSTRHYFLHLWDIPVALGYERYIAPSWYVGAEAGVQFNAITGGSGLLMRGTNDYADLSENGNSVTRVGHSYFGGIHIGKHISSRGSIQLSARFRYYPSYFSTVDPNIEQRYQLAGLHAGYVHRF